LRSDPPNPLPLNWGGVKGRAKKPTMKKVLASFIFLILVIFQPVIIYAAQRFPKPEFESGYTQPDTLVPSPRAEILAVMDVAVLLIALSVISWLIIRKRSRKGVFWASLLSLAYFGFYREGCICSIGSIQNVTLALFDAGYAIPLTAIVFFILPLIFTLFFGRTFCAGVCPFGAMQDLFAFAPQKLGTRTNAVLGVIPYLYLGLAVLYAATGTDFIICRYDPFVGIFRFNASFGMFLFTGTLLVSGIFLARPYCRFLCPYGVILNWFSRFSRKHITITPSECIRCRLCEDSCPFDAIDMPLTGKDPEGKKTVLKKFILICFLIPLLVLAGGYLGSGIHETLASVNRKVSLAKTVSDPVKMQEQPETFEVKAFRSSGKTADQVYSEAGVILKRFYTGGWILGGFIGLLFGILTASRMMIKYRSDYIPNKGRCFSCARCVDYCPIKS
jgi:NosR/NirI family transcriptional regulator, nitrous oxide reductase regulator